MRPGLSKQGFGDYRLAALVIVMLMALAAGLFAPRWYVHELTDRYESANGPLWTALVQQAWGNVLDPLWEANAGAIQGLGEALGLDSSHVLALPMRLRRLSAWLSGETVDTRDGIASTPDAIPLVYGAPRSLIDRVRERDPYLRSQAGRRLLAAMAGLRKKRTLDNTYYDSAPRTRQAQMHNNPYAYDGFRTYSFFELVRYAIMRYEFGNHEARRWYENRLCSDGGADWRYDRTQAEAALRRAGHPSPPCVGSGLHAHIAGYRPPPTFAEQVARDSQLPGQLWGAAAKRFGRDVFAAVLVLMLALAMPALWLGGGIANRLRRP